MYTAHTIRDCYTNVKNVHFSFDLRYDNILVPEGTPLIKIKGGGEFDFAVSPEYEYESGIGPTMDPHTREHYYVRVPREVVYAAIELRDPQDRDPDSYKKNSSRWSIYIGGVLITTDWKQGPSKTMPSYTDVMRCLLDCIPASMQSFEDWALEGDYSPDSRRAYDEYRRQQSVAYALYKTGLDLSKIQEDLNE